MIKPFTSIEELNQVLGDPTVQNELDWQFHNIESVPIPWPMGIPYIGGGNSFSIRVHKLMAPIFRALLWDLLTTGYYMLIEDHGGAYTHRTKRLGNALSTHSYGISWDINVLENPFACTRPPMPYVLVRLFKKHGFCWGGDFEYSDPHHLEFSVSGL